MGVLPAVGEGGDDETEMSPETAWVQLRPAIREEVFTLSFWVRGSSQGTTPWGVLVGQESARGSWWFQSPQDGEGFFVGAAEGLKTELSERINLPPGAWAHLAIGRRADGSSVVWLNGQRRQECRTPVVWPADAECLRVGGGPTEWVRTFRGRILDLCAFDRMLDDGEVARLHAAGVPRRPSRSTAARRRATVREFPVESRPLAPASAVRRWAFRHFTTEDGLPGNIVRAVLQDRVGFLWVGTERGLARYDGHRFRTFDAGNTPALARIGETVWCLAEDEQGAIWAGIFGGLLRVRHGEFTAFTNGLPQRFVLQVAPTGNGDLWVAGFHAGIPRGPCWLRRYDPERQRTTAEVVVAGHIRRLVPMGDGVGFITDQPQWVQYWDGRSRTPVVRAVANLSEPGYRVGAGWEPASPGALEGTGEAWGRDAHGYVRREGWARLRHGGEGPAFYWRWDPRVNRPMAGRWAGGATEDEWVGASFGLARIRDGVLEDIPLGAEEQLREVSCLCANREGGVWVGTEEDGLHLIRELPVSVLTTRDGLMGNEARTVCVGPSNSVWIATSGGGWVWPDRRGAVSRAIRLRSMVLDRGGDPWIGFQEFGRLALRRGSRDGGDAVAVDLGLDWQDPSTLMFAHDGTLWVACERGLTWVRPERLRRTPERGWIPDPAAPGPTSGRLRVGWELPEVFPVGLVEAADGAIWLGTAAHGLIRVTGGTQVERYTRADGLPGDRCEPVLAEADGAVWVTGSGTLTRALGGRFRSLGEREGLPRDEFFDMIEDQAGNFWVSGKLGVHRLSRRAAEEVLAGRESRLRVQTLGTHDGLLTPECSSLHHPSLARTADGRIWVATRVGVASFDPAEAARQSQRLPVVVERVVVNRVERPEFSGPGRESAALVWPPGSGQSIEFHFAAASLLSADRTRFRYRLEGYDTTWSPATDLRLAFYTNLRPGDYRFIVQATTSPGDWDGPETALRFRLQPRFWQTPLFLGFLVALVAAMAWAGHRIRVMQLRQAQELQHQRLFTEEKARIAADMHDELGAALTQIVILGEVGKTHTTDPSHTFSTLDRISHGAREVTARLGDLVWATNPRHDRLDSLVAYLRQQTASALEMAEIAAQLEFPSEVPPIQVSATFRRNVLLVVKEALNNVLRHAHASHIRLILEIEAGRILHVRIVDDGRGFDPDQPRDGGNGIGNLRRRAADLGGALQLRSAPGAGTSIQLTVPLEQT